MRTRNALERLAAAAPPAPFVDSAEEDAILTRIVQTHRSPARRTRPVAIALVAAAVIGAAIAAVAMHGHPAPSGAKTVGSLHAALTGASIEAAGYHFKTPAGFAAADSCDGTTQTPSGNPDTPVHAMRAAASADGGCLYLFLIIPQAGTPPSFGGATPVDVGSYQGYYVPANDAGESTLYIALPRSDPAANGPAYLGLQAQGLTEDQVIAVAQSGLPFNP